MISVFFTVSGRPEMFRRALQSLIDTTHGYEVEVVCVIDADYQSWDVANEFGCGVWFRSTKSGALQGWNDALTMTNGSILVPAGDDQVFHPDWLKYALESHNEKLGGYGVVGMNDLAYNGNTQVATMFLFDQKYCQDHMGGIFAPPLLHYYCVDSWWNDKAKMLEKFFWDERSVVEHLHSAHGKRPVDSLDIEKMNAGWMEEDNRIYAEQKALGLPVTWEPLI
jgi:hypothetical protein